MRGDGKRGSWKPTALRARRQGSTRRPRYCGPDHLWAIKTATRRGKIAAMRWEYVDRRAHVLLIPETQNGTPRRIRSPRRRSRSWMGLPGALYAFGRVRAGSIRVFPIISIGVVLHLCGPRYFHVTRADIGWHNGSDERSGARRASEQTCLSLVSSAARLYQAQAPDYGLAWRRPKPS